MSQDTINKIKRGRKLMKKNEQKSNLIAEIFEDPKKSCIALGALGCLLALLDMPEGFYVVLRFVVVAASIASIWLLQKSSHGNQFKTIMSLLLGILAVIFNPVMPLDLEREQWAFFNLAGAGLLLGTFFTTRGKVSPTTPSQTKPITPTPLASSADRTSGVTPEPRPQSYQPKEEKGTVFYRVLEFPPAGVQQTLSNIHIRASASIEKTSDGTAKTTLTVNDGAKPHHVFEAQAAIFWKLELHEGRVTTDQAIAWVDALSQATAKQYWGKLDKNEDKKKELFHLAPLAKATVQYAFTNAVALGVPPSFVDSIKKDSAVSTDCETIVSGAAAMDAAEKLGLIDPAFTECLSRCFKTGK
jgi:hypothetical protein